MAGFSLKGVFERIPCPYCGSTDCCGIREIAGQSQLVCCETNLAVTAEQLESQATKRDMSRYKIKQYPAGWQSRIVTYVGKGEDAGHYKKGSAFAYHPQHGIRGEFPTQKACREFIKQQIGS